MTETKAPYTVFTAAVAPAEMTVDDLEALKVRYIAQGKKVFDDLALITAAFGASVNIRYRNYRVWQRGRITAMYSTETGRRIEKEDRFAITEVLSIFLDLESLNRIGVDPAPQVCYLKAGDEVDESEQRFISGRWLDEMLAYLPAAVDVARQQQDEITEARRLKLARELMIGADI